MHEQKNIFVSLVIVLPANANIPGLAAEYTALLAAEYAHYELLLIDSGNCDRTMELNSLLARFAMIRYLKLAGSVSHEVALSAGLENAIGDIIVLATPVNLTPEAMREAVKHCCAGNDVVIGCADVKRPLWYRAGSTVFRLFFGRMIDYDLPPDDTWLRAVSRRAANAVMNTPNFHHHLLIRLGHAGFGSDVMHYEVPRSLKKAETMPQVFGRALSMLVFNSIKPLRFINILGLAGSMLAFIFGLYSVLIRFIRDNVVEGWTTMILFTSIQMFLMFLILAFLGEYVIRLLLDRSDAAAYNVVYEKHSSVMLDTAELNVMTASEAGSVNMVQSGRDR